MTVLFILISTDPLAGSTKSFMTLLRGILKAGVKVVAVAPDQKGIYTTLRDMGVDVIVQNNKSCTWTGARNLKQTVLYIPRQVGRLLYNVIACRKLEKQLEGMAFDLIHSNCTISPFGRYIARKRGVPHLYHIREHDQHYFPTTGSFRRYLRSEGVYSICITRDILHHHCLEGHPATRLIYNGIIEDTSAACPETGQRDGLLYAGRIEPNKGLLHLVEAYNDYARQVAVPLPLLVAGEVFDPGYMQRIDTFIQQNGLQQHIQFLGKVSNMPPLYKRAKAIVISSELEAFGRCMPEAMTQGCLVIGHNTSGTREQFDNGLERCGTEIGFRYNNHAELVQALLDVHHITDDKADIIRRNAYKCVTHLYTNEAYIKAVLDFYQIIAQQHNNNR